MLESAASHWPQLSALLDDALALPPALRGAWLDALPQAAMPLRDMLARLIESQHLAEAQDFLVTLPRLPLQALEDEAGDAASAIGGAPATGQLVGPYLLQRELGVGGMGSVWLAERADGVLKRPLALKLPHAGLATQAFADRLARERDILASLAHPNIARLYDAGLSAEGRPYLALEYVAGCNLIAHADAKALGVRERVRLFLQVLAAVQYAHSQLVIHRDLKPGNVLVDEGGQVRLLDFGIAKLIGEQGRAASTELTEWGGRALTVDYASPEQIAGAPLGTASDVYSLGVLLFELLTGTRPYRLQRGSRAELEEAILSADARRPSDAAPALKAALRGDLDAIVLKALAKRPDQRYASAEAMRLDLQRHLDGEPVLAQPERSWRRAARLLRRHRWSVGAALLVLVLLSAALASALWQARQARIEARTARAVQGFFEDIFALNDRDNADPVKARETTARQLLDRAMLRIDAELADEPEARLHMLELMAQLYSDYRVSDRAVALHRMVADLSRQLFGPDHPRVALALAEMAEVMSRYPASRADQRVALEQAAAILARRPGQELQLQALVQRRLSNHWVEFDNARAVAYAESAVALSRREGTPKSLAQALLSLGVAREAVGKLAGAEEALVDAGRALERDATGDAGLSIRQQAYLGRVQQRLQKYGEAEHQMRSALALAQTAKGEHHADTIQSEYKLGRFLAETGRLREALATLQDAEARAGRSDDVAHLVALVKGARGAVQARLGLLEAGLQALHERAAEHEQRGANSASHGQLLMDIGLAQIELGQQAEARVALDRAKTILAATDPGAPARREAAMAEASWWLAAGRADEAQRQLALSPAAAAIRNAPPDLLDVLRAEIDLARGDTAAALAAARAVEAAVAQSPVQAYLDEAALRAQLVEGRALHESRRCAEAVAPLAHAAMLAARIYDEANSPSLADALVLQADCALSLGHRAEALALAQRARAIHARHATLAGQHRDLLRRLDANLLRPGGPAMPAHPHRSA